MVTMCLISFFARFNVLNKMFFLINFLEESNKLFRIIISICICYLFIGEYSDVQVETYDQYFLSAHKFRHFDFDNARLCQFKMKKILVGKFFFTSDMTRIFTLFFHKYRMVFQRSLYIAVSYSFLLVAINISEKKLLVMVN